MMDRTTLIGGIVASCLLTLVSTRSCAIGAGPETDRRHLAALESLNEISTAISGKLGSGREIMQQLADAARS